MNATPLRVANFPAILSKTSQKLIFPGAAEPDSEPVSASISTPQTDQHPSKPKPQLFPAQYQSEPTSPSKLNLRERQEIPVDLPSITKEEPGDLMEIDRNPLDEKMGKESSDFEKSKEKEKVEEKKGSLLDSSSDSSGDENGYETVEFSLEPPRDQH